MDDCTNKRSGIVASVVCCVYRVRLLGLKDTTWEAGSVAIAM